MGKLTHDSAKQLVESGVLTKKSFEEMQEKGKVRTRGRNPKRYMKAADGAQVSPTLYFRGGSGHAESPEQIELRNKVNELIKKYTEPIKNGG